MGVGCTKTWTNLWLTYVASPTLFRQNENQGIVINDYATFYTFSDPSKKLATSRIDLTTSAEAVVVAASETGQVVGAASEALGVVAELEAEVEHTVVEVEVELTVLILKTS